jgi:hypothetical protein
MAIAGLCLGKGIFPDKIKRVEDEFMLFDLQNKTSCLVSDNTG